MQRSVQLIIIGLVMVFGIACATTRNVRTQVSDGWITAKVKSKLAADPEVTALNVNVDTIDGVVTLNGLVRDERQRDEAEHLARNTDGVREVRNLLEVKENE